MRPAALRRVHRQLEAIIKNCGERCSLCNKPLTLNARTYGGVTRGGVVAYVGDCCRPKLATILGVGLFVSKEFAPLLGNGADKAASVPAEFALSAVGAVQQLIAGYQRRAADTSKRAGVGRLNTRMVLEDLPWKSDDAAWFESHPERSHRLRKAHPGEMEHMFGDRLVTPPPHHEWQVLIRQVEPGRRIRLALCGDVSADVPDLEPILHAYFDLVAEAQGSDGDRRFTADNIMRRAEPYWDMTAGATNA